MLKSTNRIKIFARVLESIWCNGFLFFMWMAPVWYGYKDMSSLDDMAIWIRCGFLQSGDKNQLYKIHIYDTVYYSNDPAGMQAKENIDRQSGFMDLFGRIIKPLRERKTISCALKTTCDKMNSNCVNTCSRSICWIDVIRLRGGKNNGHLRDSSQADSAASGSIEGISGVVGSFSAVFYEYG